MHPAPPSFSWFLLSCFRFLILARGSQLALDVASNQVHCKEVAEVAQLRILLEMAQVRKRHFRAQLGHALFGNPAVWDQVRIALEDGFGEQLATRDLDPEFTLKAEDDVEE